MALIISLSYIATIRAVWKDRPGGGRGKVGIASAVMAGGSLLGGAAAGLAGIVIFSVVLTPDTRFREVFISLFAFYTALLGLTSGAIAAGLWAVRTWGHTRL